MNINIKHSNLCNMPMQKTKKEFIKHSLFHFIVL